MGPFIRLRRRALLCLHGFEEPQVLNTEGERYKEGRGGGPIVEKGWAEREDGREGEKGTNHREVSGMRWCREMEMVVARGVMSRSQAKRVEP